MQSVDATTLQVHCGAMIKVLSSTKYPELAGIRGRIYSNPAHPSSLISLLLETGSFVKLQATSIRCLEIITQPLSIPALLNTKKYMLEDPEAFFSAGKRFPEMVPVSPSPAVLTVGTYVTIVATENVQQRAPQRVGVVGVIREVPVHPITWFKVAFSDGKVLAFRPSALQPLKDDQVSLRLNPSAAGTRALTACAEVPPSVENTANQLFMICRGKFSGATGRIIKSGNGWVQLLIPSGEVSKRAHEVEPVGHLNDFRDVFDIHLNKRIRSDSALTDGEFSTPEISSNDSCSEMPFEDEWMLPPSQVEVCSDPWHSLPSSEPRRQQAATFWKLTSDP